MFSQKYHVGYLIAPVNQYICKDVITKQLLDEVEHDIINYHNRGLCYCENRIQQFFLLYIFHLIHPQKQKRSVQPFCFYKGLSNQADVELDMINALSAADIAFIMSSSQAIVN